MKINPALRNNQDSEKTKEAIKQNLDNPRQLEILYHLGCDEIQGYLYSPPVAEERFVDLLHSGKTLPVPP